MQPIIMLNQKIYQANYHYLITTVLIINFCIINQITNSITYIIISIVFIISIVIIIIKNSIISLLLI